MNDTLTNQGALIKAVPHWRFLIRPYPEVPRRFDALSRCKSIAEASTVRFRGWPFPFLSNEPGDCLFTHDSFGAKSDAWGHHEVFRLFMSGQFIYLSSVREYTEPAWRDKLFQRHSTFISRREAEHKAPLRGFFSLVNMTYTVSEFFEFASRYVSKLSDVSSVRISLGLHKVESFMLSSEPDRWLRGTFIANQPDVLVDYELPADECVSDPRSVSGRCLVEIATQFGWDTARPESFSQDIAALYSMKL